MVSLPALPKVLSGKQGCLQMKTYWIALFFCFVESALQNKCNTQVHCFSLYYLKLHKVLFRVIFFYIYISLSTIATSTDSGFTTALLSKKHIDHGKT